MSFFLAVGILWKPVALQNMLTLGFILTSTSSHIQQRRNYFMTIVWSLQVCYNRKQYAINCAEYSNIHCNIIHRLYTTFLCSLDIITDIYNRSHYDQIFLSANVRTSIALVVHISSLFYSYESIQNFTVHCKLYFSHLFPIYVVLLKHVFWWQMHFSLKYLWLILNLHISKLAHMYR